MSWSRRRCGEALASRCMRPRKIRAEANASMSLESSIELESKMMWRSVGVAVYETS